MDERRAKRSSASATLGWLPSFVKGQRGSLMTWAALLMVPLLGFVGLGVDTARGYMVRARLSQSLDSAALAAGRQASNQVKAEEEAKMVFKANFPPGYMDATVTGPSVTFNTAAETVSVSASAVLPTYFVHLLGFDTFTVSASTEVTRKTVFMDVVISIDVSGSMGAFIGGARKIDAARDAARTLVDVLFGASETKDLLKMGLLTWNSNVRILPIGGVNYIPSQVTTQTVPTFKNPYTGTNQSVVYFVKGAPVPLLSIPPSGWTGCTHARFLNDSVNNDADLYVGTPTVGGKEWKAWKPAVKNYRGRTMQCTNQGIQRLTNIRGQMISAIQQVKNPSNNTNLITGLMWAWRVLGVEGPFAGDGTPDPKPGEGDLIRAVVLMTDGANTQSSTDAYEGALNQTRLDERTALAAQKIKSAGIVIYTIRFGNDAPAAEALLKRIASGPTSPYYQYAPDAAALTKAFQEIGNHLSKLRISR